MYDFFIQMAICVHNWETCLAETLQLGHCDSNDCNSVDLQCEGTSLVF